MAMSTTLQMVTPRELAWLESHPTWINQLDKPGDQTFSTYYACCLNYFVVGDAWPGGSRRRPLGGMLYGFRSISTPTLENGNFGVLEPQHVPMVLGAFTSLDVAAIRKAVEDADEEQLEEDEVDDYEILVEHGEPPADVIASELDALVTFYKRAARGGFGIVSYTT